MKIQLAIATNRTPEGKLQWTAHGADSLTFDQAAQCVSHHGGPPVHFITVEVPDEIFEGTQVGSFEVETPTLDE
jgi:hypothetical protein